MAQLAPLKSTQRIVEWDELPARAREIPEGFDPLADGVLMKHQAEFVGLRNQRDEHGRPKYSLLVSKKGRRTGITFAVGLDSTITAGSRKSAGGDNVFYIGDTKEKGLEFIGYCAKMARVMAEAQGGGVSGIEEFLFEDQNERGDTREISAYRIRFASGFQIVALSSRPANIRGLQGIVVIDEAAYHADVQGVLDASTALLIWGGQIIVISTHNGKRNPYNQLIRDIENGVYGDSATVYTSTFDDAVENGLYERVCFMNGWEITAEGKRDWYTRIRTSYGPRKAAMREELDAIPRDSGGVSIPGVWIEQAMTEDRPVLRLALDDDFIRAPEDERIAWGNDWIRNYLRPLLQQLNPSREHVAGMDFARHRHFSVIIPLSIEQDLGRRAPWVIEMANVPTRQQEQILWAILDSLPNFRGAAMDATGPGQTLAEYTAGHCGEEMIHQINLSRKWYGEWMPKMVERFETSAYDLPRDISLENDLRAVEQIDGIHMVPKIEKKDLKDPELYRHGDGAIALALAEYAAINKVYVPIEFQKSLQLSHTTSSMANFMRT